MNDYDSPYVSGTPCCCGDRWSMGYWAWACDKDFCKILLAAERHVNAKKEVVQGLPKSWI